MSHRGATGQGGTPRAASLFRTWYPGKRPGSPQDVELTVAQCHPALRPGCSAAFSVDNVEGEERLVVAQEVQLHALVLLEPASLPKTSSGKVQRHAARAGFIAGELPLVSALWTRPADAPRSGASPTREPLPPRRVTLVDAAAFLAVLEALRFDWPT